MKSYMAGMLCIVIKMKYARSSTEWFLEGFIIVFLSRNIIDAIYVSLPIAIERNFLLSLLFHKSTYFAIFKWYYTDEGTYNFSLSGFDLKNFYVNIRC